MTSNEQMPITDLIVQSPKLSLSSSTKSQIPYCKYIAESQVWGGGCFTALLNKYEARCSYFCAWTAFFILLALARHCLLSSSSHPWLRVLVNRVRSSFVRVWQRKPLKGLWKLDSMGFYFKALDTWGLGQAPHDPLFRACSCQARTGAADAAHPPLGPEKSSCGAGRRGCSQKSSRAYCKASGWEENL